MNTNLPQSVAVFFTASNSSDPVAYIQAFHNDYNDLREGHSVLVDGRVKPGHEEKLRRAGINSQRHTP